ncbi:MAG: hypothetical protein PHC44_07900 [Lutispora sp.]|nr:hypothetical protein [Lutispora sp.]MDD4834643.1 hypothetical protein [Lutispora sp.]
MKNKKRMLIGGIFICLAFITCCMFPFLNLTKETPIRMEVINWLVIVVSIMFYHSIGQSEAKLFPNSSAMFIILFNLIATIVGMGSRFLLEFGEVSNTYNFTIPNIILHIVVAVVLSSVTWLFLKKSTDNN